MAVYPGYFTYDGLVQLDQFHKNKLSAWQPLTHTMLLNVLVDFGINVFQSASVGITIYCILQALLIISTFSYLVVFLAKRKVPSVLLLGITIFVALNPIVQILSFSTIKETFFICFFILFFMFLIEMLEDPEKYFSKKINILKPIVVAIIMSLFRKQGIYIFMILIPVSAIFLHKYWKQLLILFSGVLIPTFLFFGPITKALNVKESPISEMLSIPIQQISAVVVNNKDSLTEEEWETIKRYFNEESFKNYIPQISDPIKDNFNNEEIKKDKLSFIKLWISLGLKNKNIYAKSFIDMNIGYFYPSVKTVSNWAVIHPYIENNPYNIKLNSLCRPYYNYLQSATNYFFEGRPLITLYVCEAMPTWVILIILIVLIYKKQYTLIIPIFGLLLYLATCFLAPVCCIRYVYPLIMSLILVVSLPFMKKPNKQILLEIKDSESKKSHGKILTK